jgi:uncharacterized protein YbjT (DUF2867 family)
MKVLVCGASGLIGSAIATRLERDGHQVVRGVRHPKHPGEIAIDYTTDLTADQWLFRLDGIEVVINAIGILVERGAQTFEYVHALAPIALFTACRMRGVQQVIQISALGAESRETPYFASKCAADDFLLAQPIQAHVIRPSLVYAADGASARFFRTIASLPVYMLPASGRQALRPVHIDDLAELVVRLLSPTGKTANCSCIPVVGNTQVTYREMLGAYRKSMGLAPAFTISISAWAMHAAAAVCRWLPGSTLTPDTWRMLQRGSTADAQPTIDALGRTPRSIETFIESGIAPALRAEALTVWHGMILRIALAAVWIGSAVISAVVYPYSESLTLLGRLNLYGLAANVALYGACVLDFVLGIATLLRPGRMLWLVQMGLILVYSALIAVALPEFLIEPFGPILKNVPMLAALILLFSEETRP